MYMLFSLVKLVTFLMLNTVFCLVEVFWFWGGFDLHLFILPSKS